MPKGIPKMQYSGEFKQQVIETMHADKLSCKATARQFGINDRQVRGWERIYLAEGAEALYVERRGRGSKGRPMKLDRVVEEDLLAENQRLRAENDYLKNLHALVSERVRRENGHK